MRTIRLLSGALFLMGVMAANAGAAELKVLSTEAMKPALQELAPAFEKASGHKLVLAFASDENVEKKVDSDDDDVDVAILTKARIDKLVKSARILTFPKVLAHGSSPDLVYVVGLSMTSEQPIAAKALLDFLAGTNAKEVYKAKGLQTS